MEGFEPPKYLTGLIAAVNDGAKAAQASALLFLLVGLYLLATAFSSSDEDLLLGKAVTISQIGASLPASFSFAIAPLVFVFLHIYTLVRYDLLAANVRQFRDELRNTVPLEADRERCRQLLANVEFIMVLTTPHRSALYSRFWTWLFCGTVGVFPVMVLLLVQINALRYQSDLIVWTQRTWLAVDFAALVWFYHRNTLDGSVWPEGGTARIRRWARLLLAPFLIGMVNLIYLGTVPVDVDAFGFYPWRNLWSAGNPLDIVFCPRLSWGCRFLRVDNRTLVDKVWDEKALGILHMRRSLLETMLAQEMPGSDPDQKATAARKQAMAEIEGVSLRERSLRFAVLDGSSLYAADLINADLRHATLVSANLRGAQMSDVNLLGANLLNALLSDTYLDNANLSHTNLRFATLRNAGLEDANLSDADLSRANLRDADLSNADLRGTNLADANLDGATLDMAHLDGQSQLDAACGRPEKLPAGLTLDKPCPPR